MFCTRGTIKAEHAGSLQVFQYQVNIESVCSVFFFRCTAKTREELSVFLLAFLNGFVTGCSYRRFRSGGGGGGKEDVGWSKYGAVQSSLSVSTVHVLCVHCSCMFY